MGGEGGHGVGAICGSMHPSADVLCTQTAGHGGDHYTPRPSGAHGFYTWPSAAAGEAGVDPAEELLATGWRDVALRERDRADAAEARLSAGQVTTEWMVTFGPPDDRRRLGGPEAYVRAQAASTYAHADPEIMRRVTITLPWEPNDV